MGLNQFGTGDEEAIAVFAHDRELPEVVGYPHLLTALPGLARQGMSA
jgi:hypothetical protein